MTQKTMMYLAGGGVAVVTCACGYLGHKLNKLAKKVGMSVDELANAESRDIREEMIQRSIDKAAGREVRKYTQEAVDETLRGIKAEVKKQVKAAMDDSFSELKGAVEEEIAKQAAAIDHQALKKDVTEKAKAKILEKFDGNLDDILKDFSDNLDRVKKIYTSISDTLSERDSGKEIRFKVG